MTGRLPGPVIAIAGPTASGKSTLADRVASALGTAVISCDAMQVYRGMDIGTAKLPVADRRARLLMVDVIDVDADYSVALFQEQARAQVDALLGGGMPAVLCGGTGLYMDAVIDEMSFPAGGPAGVGRARWEAFAREHGAAALHVELSARDADSATLIHPHNVRRVVRALELLDQGDSYAARHRGLRAHVPHYDAVIWGITMGRERLYARIDARVDAMFERGLVEEARSLAGRGLRASRTASQAIGYREALAYLDGACSLAEAREAAKRRTRRYAKRQLSWLRRDGRVRWLDYDLVDEPEAARLVLGGARAGDGHDGAL